MQASLSEIDGTRVMIHRQTTDWADVVKGRPLVDKRCSDLADLYPSPRNVLSKVLGELESMQDSSPSIKPPSMR